MASASRRAVSEIAEDLFRKVQVGEFDLNQVDWVGLEEDVLLPYLGDPDTVRTFFRVIRTRLNQKR